MITDVFSYCQYNKEWNDGSPPATAERTSSHSNKSDCSSKDVTARDQYVSVHFRIDTRSEAAGTFEQKVKTFANGTAEE